MDPFKNLCRQLELEIESSYVDGVTLEQAEKLAARFLLAQMAVSRELQKSDLDARMRKSGLKAIKAAVYSAVIKTADKRPTEAALEHSINIDETVAKEQDAFDVAEANRDELSRLYNVFLNAHIYYRGVSKGRFE